MSIMPGTIIDLQEYEFSLIRGVICNERLWPPSPTPGDMGLDKSERAVVELNRRKANDLYEKYRAAQIRNLGIAATMAETTRGEQA